jgi:glycosyltransferase involved in cell wall biosynthesis
MTPLERLQPDIYQRYELLRRLLEEAADNVSLSHRRILDVGSGPDRLTELAVGPDWTVVPADVGDTGDPELVRLRSGAPLPFEDDEFEFVVALDVLEHVPPPLRPSFLDECGRVARHVVVVACPTSDDDVATAERRFTALTTEESGVSIDFLEEHELFGLPGIAATAAAMGHRCDVIAVAGNAPLKTWVTANLIDFVVNFQLGPNEVKGDVAQAINRDSVVSPAAEPCYRRFFIGSPSRTIDVERLADAVRDKRPVADVDTQVRLATAALSAAVARHRSARSAAESESIVASTRIAALELQVASEQRLVARERQSVARLEQLRGSLEEQLRRSLEALAAAATEFAQLETAFNERNGAEVHDVADTPILSPRGTSETSARRVVRRSRRAPRWFARNVRRLAHRARGTVATGARELPQPTPEAAPARFDSYWYSTCNPDVVTAGEDPWRHYQLHGRDEGRSPHALFDRAWYLEAYPDVRDRDVDPFLDWASRTDRNPNEFMEVDWYLARHPEVAEASLDPVEHYRLHGWREGRKPGPLFDPVWYLGTYPDVVATNADPLTHYLRHGRAEGRHANHLEHVAAQGSYRPPDGLIPWFSPVSFELDRSLAKQPRLNVLIPGLGLRHLTGGPNTAIQLGYRLAATGIGVRFIATDAPLDDDVAPLWRHMASITGLDERLPTVEIVDGSNRYVRVAIGENDLFLATAWWTAQSVKAALPLVGNQRFFYLIQDFEPLFFASSSQYALAIETYGLDHVPIVNSQLLLDHLVNERVGRFADPAFVASAFVFEPSVDRTSFHPEVPRAARTRRRLLFYARPTNGLRNLFELGIAAIQLAAQQGVFDDADWDFCGMGEVFEPVAVGSRAVLRPVPWRDFDGYAEQMRESDVLLSLMLAPHPSYPPLEMAACGGLAVTTEFGPKTAERLAAISPNVIATDATVEGVAAGLAEAVRRLDDLPDRLAASTLALPATWDDVFAPLVPDVRRMIDELRSRPIESEAGSVLPDRYGRWRRHRIASRACEYVAPDLPDEITFSLMTPVWNTSANHLRTLADSVLRQDLRDGWEWVIVDNASTRAETLEVLREIATDPRVRIQRSETNSGILGGMRSCLDRSAGRYVVHVDHDDALTLDALRVLAASLAAAGWPPAFYTDEDKLRGHDHLAPYAKPRWDPVLFVNSCYVAHLCGVDRELALRLGAYDDPSTEASPDWDLFMRILVDGHVPLHVPEILYSWRIHGESTAGDTTTKPYAAASHRRVLERFVASRGDFDHFSIEIHPDSPDQLDYWIRRRHVGRARFLTVVVGGDAAHLERLPAVDHELVSIAVDDLAGLAGAATRALHEDRLLHVIGAESVPAGSEWLWEAIGVLELHPDVVAVGGPVVVDGRIESAGDVFGFGAGLDSPGRGEIAGSRGSMGHLLKQRTVDAVRADHLVVRPHAALRALAVAPDEASPALFGGWLGVGTVGEGRIVYSPVLRVDSRSSLHTAASLREHGLLARAAAAAAPTSTRSPWLSLDVRRPNELTVPESRRKHLDAIAATAVPAKLRYHEWLERRIAARSARAEPIEGLSIAVITPVYGGTDAAHLRELADCLSAQTLPYDSWVIGIDGEIDDSLQSLLDTLTSADDRIVTTGGPKQGILGTMRACLAEAHSDYVVPVDADDLLTPDALTVLATIVLTDDRPGLVYSDEDVLDGDEFRDPFLRPDWDPVLHLSSSYVWHALCIRRDLAGAIGLYDDATFEWCHDWDTVERVRASGERIVHVPEVLYHWRRHEASSTNTDAPESRQQVSVRGMFERFSNSTGHPERYEVEEFPLWRGAREFHLRRLPVDARPLALLSVGPIARWCHASVITNSTYPLCHLVEGPSYDATVWEFAEALRRLTVPHVALLDPSLVVGRHDGLWDAMKWFELAPDTAIVSGRIVDADGCLTGLMRGNRVDDPGPYALALKSHSVATPDLRLSVAEVSSFLLALDEIDSSASLKSSVDAIASALHAQGHRIVFEPLLMAGDGGSSSMPPIDTDLGGRYGLAPIHASRTRFS